MSTLLRPVLYRHLASSSSTTTTTVKLAGGRSLCLQCCFHQSTRTRIAHSQLRSPTAAATRRTISTTVTRRLDVKPAGGSVDAERSGGGGGGDAVAIPVAVRMGGKKVRFIGGGGGGDGLYATGSESGGKSWSNGFNFFRGTGPGESVLREESGVEKGNSAILSEAEIAALPPHRRRAAAKKAAAALLADETAASLPTGPDSAIPNATSTLIAPDASSMLSTSSQAAPENSLKRSFYAYLSLSKPRLSILVVLTSMTSYALYPVTPLLSPLATETPSLSALTLLYLTTGTILSSASANSLNMLLEPHFDAQMSRTRNRPLVRGLLSRRSALIFAILTASTGLTLLYLGVNPTVSALSAFNIFLYAGVYTPLKRISVINTWVGAVVGGIPPLMGWAAASSAQATSSDVLEPLQHPGGWLLAGLLFAWQFPHFNALSWTIREEYKRAGYQMAAWKYPLLNARVALRYSLLYFPICFGLTYVGVTDTGFLVTSSVVNGWAVREAWRFWKNQTKATARGLFWSSVWHLPVVLGLAMVHKAGVWRGVWERYGWGDKGGGDEGEMGNLRVRE